MRLLGCSTTVDRAGRAHARHVRGAEQGDVEVAGLNGVGARCLVRHGLENDRRIGAVPTQ